ncbi:hypothetical protein AB1Y20_000311 [Prymnesium parvum]|uniref:Flavoprotein domain-containing protein n=1 Tax=Prymnesium parvum TaxID=97485 RepID=A0AB34KA25_PRYPA
MRVCLGVSGSVAAVKAPEIAQRLLDQGIHVDVVVTQSAERLMHASYRGEVPWDKLCALAENRRTVVVSSAAASQERPGASNDDDPGDVVPEVRTNEGGDDHALPNLDRARLQLWRDEDEWSSYNTVGRDEVLHVELAKRCQLLLIAPLCANTLAAMSAGSCANLLSCVVRAWHYNLDPPFATRLATRFGAHTVARPILVAPAMNTMMWHQRITSEHLTTLKDRGVQVVPPISKVLACGDEGMGAMADVDDVLAAAVNLLEQQSIAIRLAVESGLPPFSL